MDEQELKKLARLSRIEIDEKELNGLQKDMESILKYVSSIGKAPSGEGATESALYALRNVMREDAEPHESGACTEALLREAPRTEDGFFRVQKIL